MKHGDFTLLAKNYKHRTGYSNEVLDTLIDYTRANNENFTIADVGAGTGKLTEMFLQRGLSCVAVEPDDAMREEGVSQTQDYKVSWVKGNGEATTLEDNSIDWVTMASSFHWVETSKGLAEFYRILKPGGRFICLEFSHIENDFLKKIYDLWSFKIMPLIGDKVTGNREAYTYLVESIRKFPSQAELVQMLSEVGFSRVKCRNLSNGIVALHSGWKI